METLKPAVEEGKKIIMVFACQNCNWYSSLPTTTLRLTEDSKLMQETAQAHERMYKHSVKFSTR
jgi:hypothetical protein